jgi:ribosomal protein S18 acetylase RimI-like enzyme
MGDVRVSLATRPDAPRIAELHASRITEGFLPVLGEQFLIRLYRRVVASDDAFAFVAHERGPALGFCATALDVGALYKRFMVRDGVVAGALAAPQLARNVRRVLETLRYPSHAGDLPAAEILAVAVDPTAAKQGVGRALVAASQAEMERRGITAAKVVAGSDNAAAIGLYRACGFEEVDRIEVHEGIESSVLVWRASERRRASQSDALRRPARPGPEQEQP